MDILNGLDPANKEVDRNPQALMKARDELQNKIINQTSWCIYCYYGGCGIDGMDLPCFFCLGEVCCLGGTAKVVPCYDQDGCVACFSKCYCCLTGVEYPPDNTPGIGVGPARCCSNIETKTLEDCSSTAAKNELDTYQKTSWCWACYCCFQGLSYDMEPWCQQEGKICCAYVNCENASCCDDGWIEFSSKCCCCVVDASIPAGYTPGVVCCTCTICCANKPEAIE